jgi:hypothetical protein
VIAEKDNELVLIDDPYDYLDNHGVGIVVGNTLVVGARIKYLDTFGSEYETVYDNWYERKSRWIIPEHFRVGERRVTIWKRT